jgi:hypothetical protein
MSSVGLTIHERFDQIQVNKKENWTYKELSPSETITLSVSIAQIARYIGCTSKQMLDNIKGHAVTGALKLITVITLPFALYEIAESVYNFAKTTLNEKIDLVLATVSTIGGVLDIVGNIGEGLAEMGIIANHAVKWATPLSIAAVVIESMGMFLTTKSLIETYRFSVLFNEAAKIHRSIEEYDIEDYQKAREMIVKAQFEEKSFCGKHFRTDGDKLLDHLLAIETHAQKMLASENQEVVLEGKRKLQKTMHSLSGRMTSKKWCNGLSLLAGTVGIVGFGVLFSPCLPAGFILLAVSSVLSISSFFLDRYLTNCLENELGIS